MMDYLNGAWTDPVYQNTVIGIFSYMLLVGLILFPIKKRTQNTRTAWIIFTSWFFAVPIVCFFLGLKEPLPLIGLTLLALVSLKEFFQMTGLYQYPWFVWPTYFSVFVSGLAIYKEQHILYNLLPMILLGLVSQIPLLQNSFKGMVQKISLSTAGFIFIGWSFLHLGWISSWEHGARYILYIVILTEFYDTIILSWSKLFGKINFIDKIAPRRSLEGLIIGFILTMLLARGIRNILPVDSDVYWICAGLIAALIGGLGDISMGVIRRDLGVKDVGAYIFGRGGVIDRMDRLIFVAPIYYYTILLLKDYYLIP